MSAAKNQKYAAPSRRTSFVTSAVRRFPRNTVRNQIDMIVLRIARGACV